MPLLGPRPKLRLLLHTSSTISEGAPTLLGAAFLDQPLPLVVAGLTAPTTGSGWSNSNAPARGSSVKVILNKILNSQSQWE